MPAFTLEITDVACHTDDEARFLDDVHRGYGSKR